MFLRKKENYLFIIVKTAREFKFKFLASFSQLIKYITILVAFLKIWAQLITSFLQLGCSSNNAPKK